MLFAKDRLRLLLYKNQDIIPKVDNVIDVSAVDNLISYSMGLVTNFLNLKRYPDYYPATIMGGPDPMTDMVDARTDYFIVSYHGWQYNIIPTGNTGSGIASSIQSQFEDIGVELTCSYVPEVDITYSFSGSSGSSGVPGEPTYEIDDIFNSFNHYEVNSVGYGKQQTIRIVPVYTVTDLSDQLGLNERVGAINMPGDVPTKEIDLITEKLMERKLAMWNKYNKTINDNGLTSTSFMDFVCQDGLSNAEQTELKRYRKIQWL